LILLVPAEGIEPPTFGLQNRCSTAELSRREAVNSRVALGVQGFGRPFDRVRAADGHDGACGLRPLALNGTSAARVVRE
jgi:hypothetical protein